MAYMWQVISTSIMLFATAGYSLFIKLSATAGLILVEEMGTSPGFLFGVTVKAYLIWIMIAWGSFSIQSYLVFKQSDGDTGIKGVASFWPMLHGMWIGVATLWHLSGLISPFISKSFTIN